MKSPSRIPLRIAAAAFVLLSQGIAPMAKACPGCKLVTEGIERTEPQTIMAGLAFSWSVLFMLMVVGSVIGFMTVYIARTVRRLEREQSRE